MNTTWNALAFEPGSASATATTGKFSASQGELQGKFDASGEICFALPAIGENYVQVWLTGVMAAKLLDEKGQPWRTLVANGPADGQHHPLFALPAGQSSTLMLHGEPGKRWLFRWQIKETVPLKRTEILTPESPTLLKLQQTLRHGGTSEAFWQMLRRQGTPLVEEVDAHNKRVTFLWRGAQGNVFILGSPAGDHDPLFRLEQSDVWYRSYIVPADTLMQYQLAPDVPLVEGTAREQRRAILVTAQADPLNPHSSPTDHADRWNRFSLLNLTARRYFTPQATSEPIRHGSLMRYQLASKKLANRREVALYRPRGRQFARWTLIMFDGKTYQDRYHLANVLDGLMARHVLPPINIAFIDSIDGERREKELPPNVDFADFMAEELVPWLQNRGINTPARKTILAGSSYGGLASSWIALRYPELFGNVLSLSGSYWWAPAGKTPGWLTRQYQQAPRLPIRFWLQAGRFESQGQDGGIYRNTRQFAAVLQQKGYQISFNPWSSGHDYAAWCEAIIAGIKDLLTGEGKN